MTEVTVDDRTTTRPTVTSDPAPPGSFDYGLLGVVIALAATGLVMILSASSSAADSGYGDSYHYVWRQLAGLTVGGALGAAALWSPYGRIRRFAWPLYLITLVLLVLVMTPLGHTAKGATRWIEIGPAHLQPSEIARLSLVLVLSDYLANNRGRMSDVVGVGIPGLGLLLPMVVLVIFQRDFGTTAILLGLAGTLLFVAGLKWRWVLGGAVAVGGLLGFLVLIEPYRMRRLASFLDPFADRTGDGYQVVQGWIALATGGAFGTGIASGVAQRGLLPEPHTDFISAVIGEELGAVGWIAVVVLELLLVWRSATIASRAGDLFGMLAGIGIAAMFGSQALINLGVVGGLLPAKGLVLPFLSYGASAVMVHTACVGLLLRIGLGPGQAPEPRPTLSRSTVATGA
ncbi:MAG: putative peptidoglycan glycosyltransferase FtsW [Myxococcota bacterium]